MRRPGPKPGRGVALGVIAASGALVAGVLIATLTVNSIDPGYRFGREPREPRIARVVRPPAAADPFVPIRWSGFAAVPPARTDPYDEPTLLAEPLPHMVQPAPEPKRTPSEPVITDPPAPGDPVAEPLDPPPPITHLEIAEAPPLP